MSKSSYMSRLILLLLSLAALSAARGQVAPDIFWGPIDKPPGGTVVARVIAGGDWGAITLRLQENRRPEQRRVWLESYDAALQLQRRELISGKGLAVSEVHWIKDRLYVFGSRRNSQVLELVAQPLGSDLLPQGDPIVVQQLPAELRLDGRAFDWEFSKDSSQILVYYQLADRENGLEQFALHVIDNDFRANWSKTVTLEFRDENISVQDYQVDGYGRVYVQARRKRPLEDGGDLPEFLLYTFTENTDQRHLLSPESPLVTNLSFGLTARNEVVALGLYSEEATYTARGTYYLRFDPVTGTIREQVAQPLDLTFLAQAQLDNPSTKDLKTPELYRYRIQDLVMRSDGGAVLLAEQAFVRDLNRYRWYRSPYESEFRFNFNDIILMNLDPDGSINWNSRLPKRQESTDDFGYYSSFAYATVRDKLYFLFNTNPRNLSGADLNKYNLNTGRGLLVAAEVQLDGTFKFYPLADPRQVDVIARPRVSRQVDARTVIVCGDSGRRSRLGRIVFRN